MKNRKIRGERPAERTLAAGIRAWQHSPEWDVLRPSTHRTYVRYLGPLHEAMKLAPLSEIKRSHLLEIRNQIAADRGHGAALNFARATGAFFTWALENDIIEFSPALKLASKLRRGHLPAWRDDQAQRGMRDLPEPYRRAVVLAYYTGQRRGDLCRMGWHDYDGEVIRLVQEKTTEPLEIPVWRLPEFQRELERWKTERRTLTILEHRGKPWNPDYLSTWLPDQLARIGLPRELGLHGLRRLTAVRLAEAGCSTHEIAAITGHRTLAMVQEYTRGVRQQTLADVAYLRLAQQSQGKPLKNRQKGE